MSDTSTRRHWIHVGLLSLGLAVGTLPALLTYTVDPFEFFGPSLFGKAYNERAEKSHYPLWKFSHYKRDADIIVLGDSRARALREKYWEELSDRSAYNFAYGGGTIPEIYSTFQEIKDDPKIRTLVIGLQLRSFDESFKGGMNRVPEAVRVTSSATNYLKNWFVAQKSWQYLVENNSTISTLESFAKRTFDGSAKAADLGDPGEVELKTLLLPEICYGCDLPVGGRVLAPVVTKGINLGLGRGRLWENTYVTFAERELTGKFKRQVEKNARSDWQTFRFSERYFKMIEDIAQWADESNERQLVFVVPPTILEMFHTISRYGLGPLDMDLRYRLSKLGTVIDFDFPNRMTYELSNFNDAYHFNSKVARQIVGQILLLNGGSGAHAKTIEKRNILLRCVEVQQAVSLSLKTKPSREALDDVTCKIWRRSNNV